VLALREVDVRRMRDPTVAAVRHQVVRFEH
jgi:hypothetical protein